jgi:hypothetical protein
LYVVDVPDGRVVRVAPDGSSSVLASVSGAFGIAACRGAMPPDCGCSTCDDLRTTVRASSRRNSGIERSFLAKVDAACAALERGQRDVAGNVLCALLREVGAQDARGLARGSALSIRACVRQMAAAVDAPLRCDTRPRPGRGRR